MGRLDVLLRADPAMRRDCLVMERGGWNKAGHGVNALTLDMASAVGMGTPYHETCVAVRPLAWASTVRNRRARRVGRPRPPWRWPG